MVWKIQFFIAISYAEEGAERQKSASGIIIKGEREANKDEAAILMKLTCCVCVNVLIVNINQIYLLTCFLHQYNLHRT